MGNSCAKSEGYAASSRDSASPREPLSNMTTLIPQSPAVGRKPLLENEFSKYVSETDSAVSSEEGFVRFFADLNVSMEDPLAFMVCYVLGVKTIGRIERVEFVEGMDKLGLESADMLRRKLPDIKRRCELSAEYPKFFAYCFDISKESVASRRVSTAVAIPMIELLLSAKFKLSQDFVQFLQQQHATDQSFLKRDEWLSLLPFLEKYNDTGLEHHDQTEAWPVLLDEFVEWWRNKSSST